MPYGIAKNSPTYTVQMPDGSQLVSRCPIRVEGDVAFVRASNGDIEWMIDAHSVESVRGMRWSCIFGRSGGRYASTRFNNKKVLMHRLLCVGITDEMHADHINRDTLDNRSCNLRPVPPRVNQYNMNKRKTRIHLYPNVTFCKKSGKWKVDTQTTINGEKRRKHWGSSADFTEACKMAMAAMESEGKYAPPIPTGNQHINKECA